MEFQKHPCEKPNQDDSWVGSCSALRVLLLNFISKVSFVAFAGLALFSVRGVAPTTALRLRKSGRLGVAKRMVKLFFFLAQKRFSPKKWPHRWVGEVFFAYSRLDRLRRSAEFIQSRNVAIWLCFETRFVVGYFLDYLGKMKGSKGLVVVFWTAFLKRVS